MKININKKAVGGRIKQIRTNKGYTLESFGKLFGASKSNVQKWESGFTLPNKERLASISKISDITVNELLYGSVYEYIENNIDTLFRNNNVLNSDSKEKLLNEYNIINNAVSYLEDNNITINDIEAVNLGFKKTINDVKNQIPINKLQPSLYDEIYYIANELVENDFKDILQIYISNKTKEEKTKEFNEMIKYMLENKNKNKK